MALPVLEMSELIRFTKPCNKWSVQISASVRQSFNKNKALLWKEESKSTLLMAFMLLLQTQRYPYGRWTSSPTYQKQDPGTWLFWPICAFGYRVTVFLVRIAFHITEDRFFFSSALPKYSDLNLSSTNTGMGSSSPLAVLSTGVHWSALPPDANLRQPWKFKKITQLRHRKVTMCFRITEALITYIAVSLFFAPPQMVIDLNSVSPTAVFLSTLCSRASN